VSVYSHVKKQTYKEFWWQKILRINHFFF